MKDHETPIAEQIEEKNRKLREAQNGLNLHKESIEVWMATVSFLLIFAWIGYSIWRLIHRILPFGA